MKPTLFAKERHAAMIRHRQIQVTYAPFVDAPGNTNEYGGIIDPDRSYPDLYTLPALVNQLPSESLRKQFGDETDFQIVVTIAGAEFETVSVQPKVGDRLEVAGIEGYFYVVKVKPGMQAYLEYREFDLACSKMVGRDG